MGMERDEINMGRLTGQVMRELGGFSGAMHDPITRACGVDEIGPLVWKHTRERVR